MRLVSPYELNVNSDAADQRSVKAEFFNDMLRP